MSPDAIMLTAARIRVSSWIAASWPRIWIYRPDSTLPGLLSGVFMSLSILGMSRFEDASGGEQSIHKITIIFGIVFQFCACTFWIAKVFSTDVPGNVVEYRTSPRFTILSAICVALCFEPFLIAGQLSQAIQVGGQLWLLFSECLLVLLLLVLARATGDPSVFFGAIGRALVFALPICVISATLLQVWSNDLVVHYFLGLVCLIACSRLAFAFYLGRRTAWSGGLVLLGCLVLIGYMALFFTFSEPTFMVSAGLMPLEAGRIHLLRLLLALIPSALALDLSNGLLARFWLLPLA